MSSTWVSVGACSVPPSYIPLVVWLTADNHTYAVMEPRVGPCRTPSRLARSTARGDWDATSHRRSAVLVTGSMWTQVAIDGCALVQQGRLWRGTDGLRAVLTGIR